MTKKDRNSDFQYDVCLSFAGEDRKRVAAIAKKLATQGMRVFYDEYEQANLWGKDLYSHLNEIYGNSARYCILFVSRYYAKKLWTNRERQSAQARAFRQHSEYILPVRLDDTEVSGLLPTVGYVDLRKTNLDQLVKLITKKIGTPERAFYLPPVPDRLFRRMRAKSARDKSQILEHAEFIVDQMRRMAGEERRLVAVLVLNGCPMELPDNIHISTDLLRRYSGYPQARIMRILGNLRSLGFKSRVRAGKSDGHLGDDPTLALSCFLNLLDYNGPPNATALLNEMMRGGTEGLCSDHGAETLARADFGQLASVTTRRDMHAKNEPATSTDSPRRHRKRYTSGSSHDSIKKRRPSTTH